MNVHHTRELEVDRGQHRGRPMLDAILHNFMEVLRRSVELCIHLHRIVAHPLGKKARKAPRATARSSLDSTLRVLR